MEPLALAGEVTTEGLMHAVERLSRETRLSGSEEEARAFDYIGNVLTDLGYDVHRESTEALIGFPVRSTLTVVWPEQLELDCNGYSMSPSTTPEGVEAELVYVGGGLAADFPAIDLRGKCLLSDGLGMPGKSLAAQQAGAAATIHINDERIHEMCISPVWGAPTPETLDLIPTVPAVSVLAESGAALKRLMEREPVVVRVSTQPYRGWRPIPALTADLAGNEEDTFALLSGHVDSWHSGAVDNASGNAVQLEIARLLAQHRSALRRGVRIAFWSGHSHGRYAGSSAYADAHWHELNSRCVAHVNADSLGGAGADIVTEAPTTAELFEFAQQSMREAIGAELTYRRLGRAGDQSFAGIGIPGMFVTMSEQPATDSPVAAAQAQLLGGTHRLGGSWWFWHSTADALDQIDPAYLLRDARVYAQAMGGLCSQGVLPLRYSAAVAEMVTAVEGYQQVAGDRFDLATLRDRLARLAPSLTAYEAAAAKASSVHDRIAVNRTLVKLSRCLVPASHTVRGRYDQDLALSNQAVPALTPVRELAQLDPADDAYRALSVSLGRQRNRIEHAVDEAAEVLECTGLI